MKINAQKKYIVRMFALVIMPLFASIIDAYTSTATVLLFWWIGPLLYCRSHQSPTVWNGMLFNFVYWLWYFTALINSATIHGINRTEYVTIFEVMLFMQVVAFVTCLIYLTVQKYNFKNKKV